MQICAAGQAAPDQNINDQSGGAVIVTDQSNIANRIDRQRPDAPALAAYGQYKIGVRTLEVVNPDQFDMVKIDPSHPRPDSFPTYDRRLTVEVWYPAAADAQGDTSFPALLRDGETIAMLSGRAMRDAAPQAAGCFPLVILSHGYPGNRYLMAHLAENIASKGYVVAAVDHRDSTYDDQGAFGSTLVNRPIDQSFVLDQMAELAAGDGFLGGMIDANASALIGYSMGGYGALITAGAGVTDTAVDYEWGAPHGTLAIHRAGAASHRALQDPRIKTAIAIAPWGATYGVWDADGLGGVNIPTMFIAGSCDDVSGYQPGVRSLWEGVTSVDRALLTFENANHNAAAPIPAPFESYVHSRTLGWGVFEHYADPVWDTVRMNNITQHFVSAWLGKYLKGDGDMDAYLDLVPIARDGKWVKGKHGQPGEGHSYWKGFADRTAAGLRFETLRAGDSPR